MSLYNSYNNEDILVRGVIAGMLNVLNNNIKYNQIWSNEDKEEISVPWFYNQSGDERFMQDFYTHYFDCDFPKPVDGNFDRIPRGEITYAGSTIDSNRITNRFVQGRYLKEIDGQLQSYISHLYSIPLTVNFDCELWIDNLVSALKIEQAIRQTFYKTVTFYSYYKGLRLGCTSGFSESDILEKNINYSFEEENKIKLTFNIEVEAYEPVFDPTTEMKAGDYMKGIGYRMYDNHEKNDGKITITSPSASITVPKGHPLWITWTYTKEAGIINKIDTYWLNTGSNEWNIIERGVPNNEFFIWNIPDDFTDFKTPNIIWEETSNVKISREPIVSIVPVDTSTIDASSFSIVDGGYFMTPGIDASISIILEMKDDNNNISQSADGEIYFNINNYELNSSNLAWVDPSSNIIIPSALDYRIIDIHVANSVNNDVFGVVRYIKIV